MRFRASASNPKRSAGAEHSVDDSWRKVMRLRNSARLLSGQLKKRLTLLSWPRLGDDDAGKEYSSLRIAQNQSRRPTLETAGPDLPPHSAQSVSSPPSRLTLLNPGSSVSIDPLTRPARHAVLNRIVDALNPRQWSRPRAPPRPRPALEPKRRP
jgi:hypothetical protein